MTRGYDKHFIMHYYYFSTGQPVTQKTKKLNKYSEAIPHGSIREKRERQFTQETQHYTCK